MSYDVLVEHGGPVSLQAWGARLSHVGMEVEFEPGFLPETHVGGLLLALRITKRATDRNLKKLVSHGRFAAGVEFSLGSVAPGTAAAALRARGDELNTRIARLRERGAPEIVMETQFQQLAQVERLLAGAATALDRTSATFSLWANASAGCFAAAIYAAAALAEATSGQLVDTWPGITYSSDRAIEAAAIMLGALELEDERFSARMHEPFTGFDENAG